MKDPSEYEIEKNNVKHKFLSYCDIGGMPFYALNKDYYWGVKNWEPHISLAYESEIKSRFPSEANLLDFLNKNLIPTVNFDNLQTLTLDKLNNLEVSTRC